MKDELPFKSSDATDPRHLRCDMQHMKEGPKKGVASSLGITPL